MKYLKEHLKKYDRWFHLRILINSLFYFAVLLWAQYLYPRIDFEDSLLWSVMAVIALTEIGDIFIRMRRWLHYREFENNIIESGLKSLTIKITPQ